MLALSLDGRRRGRCVADGGGEERGDQEVHAAARRRYGIEDQSEINFLRRR
ncbi:MAG: hypothetical protein IPK80_13940 [Nannocystis sp.]|nr:hypothetical protein [Nannocystis sp.]